MLCVVAQQYKERHAQPDASAEFIAGCEGAPQRSVRVPKLAEAVHCDRLGQLGLERFRIIYDVRIHR